MFKTVYLFVGAVALTAPPVFAGGIADNFSDASTASVEAVGHSVEGTYRLAAGAAAVPLWLVGAPLEALGNASTTAGDALMDEAKGTPNPAVKPSAPKAVAPTKAVDPSPAEVLACNGQ